MLAHKYKNLLDPVVSTRCCGEIQGDAAAALWDPVDLGRSKILRVEVRSMQTYRHPYVEYCLCMD